MAQSIIGQRDWRGCRLHRTSSKSTPFAVCLIFHESFQCSKLSLLLFVISKASGGPEGLFGLGHEKALLYQFSLSCGLLSAKVEQMNEIDNMLMFEFLVKDSFLLSRSLSSQGAESMAPKTLHTKCIPMCM
eukprot:Platyproteum_vivax@DN15404_c0_g1_i1.p1